MARPLARTLARLLPTGLVTGLGVALLAACSDDAGAGDGTDGRSFCTDDGTLQPPDPAEGTFEAQGLWVRPRSVTAFVPGTGALVGIYFAESDDACGTYQTATQPNQELRDFAVLLDQRNLRTLPISLPVGVQGSPTVGRLNYRCANGGGGFKFARSGTVTITGYAEGETIEGQLDLEWDDGKHVTTSFSTCFCGGSKGACSTKYER